MTTPNDPCDSWVSEGGLLSCGCGYSGPDRLHPRRPPARACGHKHRCACGTGLSTLTHSDPTKYRNYGGCDRPCARCDTLDAEEAER